MKKQAKVTEEFKSYGRKALAFVLAIATFVTSINVDWSSFMMAEAAWSSEPESVVYPTTADSYQSAIDLTNDGLTFSANETGSLGAILTASEDYEYVKAVSFCVDVPAGGSFSAYAVCYQNIQNVNSISTPAGIASNAQVTTKAQSDTGNYSNNSDSVKTVVYTLYLGDKGMRASGSAGENYGVVVMITPNCDLKYYTGSNDTSGVNYISSKSADTTRALVVTSASNNVDASYNLNTSSWDGTKFMAVGESTSFAAYTTGGYKRTITYESDDKEVAEIDASTGVIMANGTGTAQITAKVIKNTSPQDTTQPASITREIKVFKPVFYENGDKKDSIDSFEYTGNEIAPAAYTGTETEATWAVDTGESTPTTANFNATYSDDKVNVGTKTITIDGGSAYPGFSGELSYEIVAQPIPTDGSLKAGESVVIDVASDTVINGTTLLDKNNRTLSLGTDYTATLTNKVINGESVTYDVNITGIGNYTGTRTITGVTVANASEDNKLDISGFTPYVNDSGLVYKNGVYSITSTDADSIKSRLTFEDSNGDEISLEKNLLNIEITKSPGNSGEIKNAGEYEIKISAATGTGAKYVGTMSTPAEFTVARQKLSDTTKVAMTDPGPGAAETYKVLHEGGETKISPKLWYEKGTGVEYQLQEGKDFEYVYTNAGSTGVAKVTMQAIDGSNFSGFVEREYTIVPNIKLTSDVVISLDNKKATMGADGVYTTSLSKNYTGKQYVSNVTTTTTQEKINVIVKDKVTDEVIDTAIVDITENYDNTNAGTGSFTIRLGNDKYNISGSDEEVYNEAEVHFTIKPKAISLPTVVFKNGADNSLYYTGDAIELASDQFDVYFSNTTSAPLVCDTDYRVTGYENNVNAGSATIKFEGINNYSGTFASEFVIRQRSIVQNGADHQSKNKTQDNGVLVGFNPDKLDNEGNLNKNYLDGDEVSLNYDAVGNDFEYTLNYVAKYNTENGTIEDYSVGRLVYGTDFTVSFSNNRKVAKATDSKAPTITITGQGNFTGTRILTFSIVPAKLYSLKLNVNSVAIVNPLKYVQYRTTGSTPETTGSSVAIEYNGKLPGKPAVEFTEKKLTEGTDYNRYFFDSKADAEAAAVAASPSDNWNVDVNAENYDYNDGYGYKYLLIQGINNYSGDYKIIEIRYIPRNIALPSISVNVTPPKDAHVAPTIAITDNGLAEGDKNLYPDTDTDTTHKKSFKLMMYDAGHNLVDFDASNLIAGDACEVVIQGIGNYKNTRSVFYKAGTNLTRLDTFGFDSGDSTKSKLTLTDSTNSELAHYVYLKNPNKNDVNISMSDVTDGVYDSVPYLGKTKTPKVQLWAEGGSAAAYGEDLAVENTSGGLGTYEGENIIVTLAKEGESDGYSAGSKVKVTLTAKSGSSLYYGSTSFYYTISPVDVSEVTIYDETALNYSTATGMDGNYPIYPYSGGIQPIHIKAKYGDEDVTVKSVTAYTIVANGTSFDLGELLSNQIDTGIIDKSISFNDQFVVASSGDGRKTYNVGKDGISGAADNFKLKIELEVGGTNTVTKEVPYGIKGIDFGSSTGDYDATSMRVVLLDKDGNSHDAVNLEYTGVAVIDAALTHEDYKPQVQVQDKLGVWHVLNENTYKYYWRKWSDASTVPSQSTSPSDEVKNRGKYTVQISYTFNPDTEISAIGRTAGHIVTTTPVLTIGPKVTSTDLVATINDSEYPNFMYDASKHEPGVKVVDNMGTPDDTSDDVTLTKDIDYSVTYADDTFPGNYQATITPINNYDGSTVEGPSYTVKGKFDDSNTYKDDSGSALSGSPLYYAAVNGTIKPASMQLYLSGGKLYTTLNADGTLANEFNESSVAMYYQDTTTGAHAGTPMTTAPNSGLIDPNNYTVTFTDMDKPGTTGKVTIKAKDSSLFKDSEIELTGFAIKADINDADVLDGDKSMEGIIYNYEAAGGAITDKISAVKWGGDELAASDYSIAHTGGTNNLNTAGDGEITITAVGANYFGTKKVSYSVKIKLTGFKVFLSDDTVLSTGNPQISYKKLMNGGVEPIAEAYIETGAGTVAVDPDYYKITITRGTTNFVSAKNTATQAKFMNGTSDVVAKTDFMPTESWYNITFEANADKGAVIDTNVATTAKFKITGISINDAVVTASPTQYTYTGSAITPNSVEVLLDSQPLSDEFYTVSYSNNTNAGTATIKVTAKDNSIYTGSATGEFTIKPKRFTDDIITVSIPDQEYTGSQIQPTEGIVVRDTERDTVLTYGTDYELATTNPYGENKNVGDNAGTVKFKGKGNYEETDTVEGTFNILKLDFQKAKINAKVSACEYTGQPIFAESRPSSYTDDNSRLIKDSLRITYPKTKTTEETIDSDDYTVSFASQHQVIGGKACIINAGKYKITITAKDNTNYTGSQTFDFTVNKKSIADAIGEKWTNASGTFSTDPNPVTSKYVEGDAYYYGYYAGIFGSETDANNMSNAKVKYAWTGSAVEPEVRLDDNTWWDAENPGTSATPVRMEKGTDYSVRYSNNVNAGAAGEGGPTITITGTGNYEGTVTKYFTIGENLEELYDSNTKHRFVVNVADTYQGDNSTLVYTGSPLLPESIDVTDKGSDGTGTAKIPADAYTFVAIDKDGNQIEAINHKNSVGYDGHTDKYFIEVTGATDKGYFGTVKCAPGGDEADGYFSIAQRPVGSGGTWNVAITNDTVDVNGRDYPACVYAGEDGVTPEMTVSYVKDAVTYDFVAGVDYTVKATNNVNANVAKNGSNYIRRTPQASYPLSTAVPELTQDGNYKLESTTLPDSAKKQFVVVPYDISNAEFTVTEGTDTWTDGYKLIAFDKDARTQRTPATKLVFSGNKPEALTSDKYSGNIAITYPGNKNRDPGLATVKAAGIGNYCGSISTNFHIVANIEDATITLASNKIKPFEDGSAAFPKATVTFPCGASEDLVISRGVDYTMSVTKDGATIQYGSGDKNQAFAEDGNVTLNVIGIDPHYTSSKSIGFTYDAEKGTEPENVKRQFSSAELTLSKKTYLYDGQPHNPAKTLVVKGVNDDVLAENTDYTVEYLTTDSAGNVVEAPTEMDTYTVMATISGKPGSDYEQADTITRTATFVISGEPAMTYGDITYTVTPTVFNYDGAPHMPSDTVTVYDATNTTQLNGWTGTDYTPTTDYYVTYVTTDAGGNTVTAPTAIGVYTRTVTITGVNDYETADVVTKSATFEIVEKPAFDESKTTIAAYSGVYDMAQHMPTVTAVYDSKGALLVENTDYVISGYTISGGNQSAKDVGTYNVTAKIEGRGNYEKADAISKTSTVTISAKDFSESDITYNTSSFIDVSYTGKPITPTTTIRYRGNTLQQNKDYEISYINNIDPGIAVVRISGKGNFVNAKRDIFFTIKTINVTGLKVSATTKNSVTLTWTKSSNVAGYQISYMNNGAKSLTTTKNSVTISGLSSGTQYSFAVRSYVKSSSSSSTFYGDPSRVSVSTK